MKRSGFAVRVRVRNQSSVEGETIRNLQEIKVVENEKHGHKDIDNHTGQNYNIENFRSRFHRVSSDFSFAARNFE
jgi:hypothetical protein